MELRIGRCHVRLTSADIAGLLDEITRNGIQLHNVEFLSDLSLEAVLSEKHEDVLERLCEKRGDRVAVLNRFGLMRTGLTLLHRPVLLLGLAIWIMAAILLPTRVWFIRVEGNQQVSIHQILEAAEASGIHFGASRREVRSEQVKNNLLEAIPQLQWAGVNTAGCVAIISVREKNIEEMPSSGTMPSSIFACVDGVILSCTATRGTLLCAPGQAVQAGETLISGYVDSGLCLRMLPAEGEILAQTRREITAVSPGRMLAKQQILGTKKNISLILGKKRINLWKDSGIWDGVCGRMYEEYYVTLPGGFTLPVALAVETVTAFHTTPVILSREDTEKNLLDFSASYLRTQMIAGTILNRDVQLYEDPELYRMEGTYDCTEMIGRVRQEQIGEYHE